MPELKEDAVPAMQDASRSAPATRQEALAASWDTAQRQLADPEWRAVIEARIEQSDLRGRGPGVSRNELIAEVARLLDK